MDNQAVQNLNKLQKIFNRILTRYLESFNDKYFRVFIKREVSEYLSRRENFLSARNIEELIIELYLDLKKTKAQLAPLLKTAAVKTAVENKFDCHCFKNSGWQYQSIAFLQKKINQDLSRFVDCSFVHGSFATKDFVNNWSDLDVKIILNDLAFENAANLKCLGKSLRKLSLICDKIDPLSHHRFSFATNFDLGYYPNSLLPIVCYQYGLLLTGSPEIKFNLRSDKNELISQMGNFIDYFKNKTMTGRYSCDLKGWKDDLSHITLWPSLLLEAKDIFIYKRESFAKVKEEFPAVDFGVVDEAGRLRQSWPGKNILRFYPNFLLTALPFRVNQMVVNYFKRYSNNQLPREQFGNIEALTKKALSLFEKTFNYD